MKILAIESSCDETAVAVVEKTNRGGVAVLGDAVASSEEMHVATGGIVPEVAAREQLRAILPTVNEAVDRAAKMSSKKLHLSKKLPGFSSQFSKQKERLFWIKSEIDAVAVTVGPGLVGSLLVGVETAKAMALGLEKPLISVNHLRGHLYAGWIENNVKTKANNQKLSALENSKVPEFPVLGLIVSGGHTDLVLLEAHQEIKWLGGTRDDAAGECLDKCARILGLPYPGGPAIAAEAAMYEAMREARESEFGSRKKDLRLPRPLLHDATLDFSFSGLKIAVSRMIEEKRSEKIDEVVRKEIAWELQEAVVEVLTEKLGRAIEIYNPNSVIVCGGVAANRRLRWGLHNLFTKKFQAIRLTVPAVKYCTDNAAMIGAAAIFDDSPALPVEKVKANPSLELY